MSGNARKLDDPIKQLTKKQENFAFEYVQNGGDATKAYLTCYDTENIQSAWTHGAELTKHPLIRNKIFQLRELYNNSIQIDPAQYLTTKLLAIAETTVFDIIDEQGQLRPKEEIPVAKQQAIEDITINHKIDKEGNNTTTYKIKLVSKSNTLEKLAKSIGYYEEHQNGRYKGTLAQGGKLSDGTVGSGKNGLLVQNNFYNMSVEELQAKLNELDTVEVENS